MKKNSSLFWRLRTETTNEIQGGNQRKRNKNFI